MIYYFMKRILLNHWSDAFELSEQCLSVIGAIL